MRALNAATSNSPSVLPSNSSAIAFKSARAFANAAAFHAAALSAAGKDNSAHSLRPDDHPHCYGAFVIDMEGNNMGAVCHRPEQAAHRNSVSSDGRIYIRIA